MAAEKSVADMTPQEAQAELTKREADKMTRRAALAKIGMRAGLGLLAAFSVDDLARLVGERMEQQKVQSAAVEKVARELHGAGVAFASVKKDKCISGINPDTLEPTCIGSLCLKDMPSCGCQCTGGATCQDCCDSKCPDGGDMASAHAACYSSCAGTS